MPLQLSKVLISDAVHTSCRDILRDNGVCVDYKPGLSKDDFLAIIKDYDALIVRSASKVTAEVIKAGESLKLIGRAGTGVDNIDLDAATAQGIIVMNTPGGNSLSAAEHTCILMCCLARNVPQGYSSLKAGRWEPKKFMGIELNGKTLAIVGLGRIGREVAIRMQSFGMRTIGYDPLVPAEEAAKFNVEFMELEKIWPVADFVTVHTPLIPATRGLMNANVFAKCKKGVRVINVARGGIIDEGALLQALESGQCAGAGLDVYSKEPPQDRSLVDHHNVVCTPHLGASTIEAQFKVAQEIAQAFVDAVQGKQLSGIVNVPELSNALSPNHTPWVELTTRLGKLVRGMSSTTLQEIKLCLTGSAMKERSRFLISALLVGCLGGANVNLVSAKSVARAAGVEVKVCLCDGVEGVTVTCGDVKVAGTVMGTSPVLTEICDAKFSPVQLSGSIVVAKETNLASAITKISGVDAAYQGSGMVVLSVSSLPETLPAGFIAVKLS